VARSGLWRLKDGSSTFLAALPDDRKAMLCGHRDKITITADGVYYVWDGDALTQPAGGAFSDVGSVIFFKQFTVMSERGGRRIQWSAVGDPETLNGLYFATAEARDDRIIRLIEFGDYFAVMKEHSVELWGATGIGGSSAFRLTEGGVIERGLKDFCLACRTPDGVFFIGEDNVAYFAGLGSAPSPVSTATVNSAIATGEPTDCCYYEDRGHRFCVLRFDDRPAWVFDVSLGTWHERAHGVDLRPWDVVASAFRNGNWHLGSRIGQVSTLGDAPYDGAFPMRRVIRSRNLFSEGKRFRIALLEIEGLFGKYEVTEVAPNWLTDSNGFPLLDQDGRWIEANDQWPVTYQNRAGYIDLKVSKDGGHTFGLPKRRSIGRVGYYRAKAKWQALGQYEDFVAEFSMTDPVDVPILSEASVQVS
jgi:hypothetical protein